MQEEEKGQKDVERRTRRRTSPIQRNAHYTNLTEKPSLESPNAKQRAQTQNRKLIEVTVTHTCILFDINSPTLRSTTMNFEWNVPRRGTW